MAARCVVAALAVLLSTVLSHHVPGHWGHVQLHVPPDSKPSFQRGAVERPPPGVVRVHGGQSHSEWLPLREAVELVPENYETQRQPLRDAVEATSTRRFVLFLRPFVRVQNTVEYLFFFFLPSKPLKSIIFSLERVDEFEIRRGRSL